MNQKEFEDLGKEIWIRLFQNNEQPLNEQTILKNGNVNITQQTNEQTPDERIEYIEHRTNKKF
ncbi:Uncharacterised protein [uncultured archaeon]|nr:Uncharacterised protein [uncultured archaeon]